MKAPFFFLLLMVGSSLQAQSAPFTEEEITINEFIEGTLSFPAGQEKAPLIIFIQGSGPTDRNGNQPMMKSDFAKKIAHELAEEGIATFRFDKRIFKMDKLKIRERDLRFEDFVEDVKNILGYFKNKDQFSKTILAGHSEGSLMGILAADTHTDAFISMAGAGRSIDSIIVDQIGKEAPGLQENTRTALDELKNRGSTGNYNPALESIFRPDVQPYMASWMKYDPATEIAQLDIPILILQGTADIQVEETEAEILMKAAPNAQLRLLKNMNHVFREIEGKDALVNTKSYNEPNRPLHPELIPTISAFVKELEIQ